MTLSFQKKLIKKATKWLTAVATLATAQIVAELLVKAIMVAVQGGHLSYLRYRNEYLKRLSAEYDITFENLEKVAAKIEDECVPWVKAARMRPLIVKLGGSVITDKRGRFSVKLSSLRRLARELKAADGPLVVVHGGGSYGHPIASKFEIARGFKNEEQLMGFSLTHRAMEELNTHVIEALQRAGLPAIAIQPSACSVVSDGRIVRMELAPLHKFLELGIVPVTYGDVVPDLSRGMSILSGDQLVVYLARELGASRVILGADVDGVFTADPKLRSREKLIRVITPSSWRDVVKSIGVASGPDVTGGMAKKVEELLILAESGIEAEIVNAAKADTLKRAILGERGLGTKIMAG